MSAKLAVLACVLAVLAIPEHARGGDIAFAQRVTATSKEIVSFPVGNPGAASVIGPQADTLSGMDFDPQANVLWAIDFTTHQIGTVNQSTGAFTSSATLQGACCFNSFAIDPVSGIFYGAKGDDEGMYSIDPLSGAEVLVLDVVAPGWAVTALGIDCAGHGVAAAVNSVGDEQLYRWQFDGNVTLAGVTGYSHATALEFDNQSGALYGWFGTTAASTHATIDPATAQTSQASVLEGRYRMAIRNSCTSDVIFSNGFDGEA
jgi:hypothetical protein